MASLNQVNLIGNLGRDPEMKTLPGGDAVCNFSIACSEKWKDKNSGEWKESTEWINIVIFGKLAEVASQYLRKGSQVFISGKIKTRKWQDKNTGQDRYTTEIHASEMKMLDRKSDGDGGRDGNNQQRQQERQQTVQQQRQQSQPRNNDFDDDLPF